jgi:hypothetical protein
MLPKWPLFGGLACFGFFVDNYDGKFLSPVTHGGERVVDKSLPVLQNLRKAKPTKLSVIFANWGVRSGWQ